MAGRKRAKKLATPEEDSGIEVARDEGVSLYLDLYEAILDGEGGLRAAEVRGDLWAAMAYREALAVKRGLLLSLGLVLWPEVD